jgi:hypothetical protein
LTTCDCIEKHKKIEKMKKIEKIIIGTFLMFFCQITFAQYGNGGYGNGYGNGGYGSNSRAGQDFPADKPKPVPVEETVAKVMVKIKEALNLDALQEIAISNLIKDNMKAQGVIMKREGTTDEEKMKDLQVLTETTDRKVKELLNAEQKEKYIVFCEESKNPKKAKKKK